jgi:hypothetical protein
MTRWTAGRQPRVIGRGRACRLKPGDCSVRLEAQFIAVRYRKTPENGTNWHGEHASCGSETVCSGAMQAIIEISL